MKNSNQANSRRRFLGTVGGLSAATVGVSVIGLPALAALTETTANANEIGRTGAAAGAASNTGCAGEEFHNALFQQIGRLKVELDLKNGLLD